MLKRLVNIFKKENLESATQEAPVNTVYRGIVKINDNEYLGCFIQEGNNRTICLNDGIGRIKENSTVEFIDECPTTHGIEFNVDCYYNHYCTQLFSI